MGFMGAAEGAQTRSAVLGAEQAVGLDDAALAVDPLGLDRVEPGALDRQVAGDDAHAAARRCLTCAVVVADPGAHRLADVPGGVVPDQQQRRLARGRQLARSTSPGSRW